MTNYDKVTPVDDRVATNKTFSDRVFVDNAHQMAERQETTMLFYNNAFRTEHRNNEEQLSYLQEQIAELFKAITPLYGEGILSELQRTNDIYKKEQSAPMDLSEYPIPSPVFQIMGEQIAHHKRNRDKVALILQQVEYLTRLTRTHI
jgi:hypothetical protein